MWDTVLADWRENYSGSSAPLPAGDLVDDGRRRRRARRQRLRGGGRPGHGQGGLALPHRPAPGRTRLRDMAGQGHRARRRADLVHRQLRPGARPRLLADRQSVEGVRRLAIAWATTCTPPASWRSIGRTGALRWHYQFTPHDLWDWDATQTSVLVDAPWQGQPAALLLHASRNGFFYVFDRATGERLLSTPFVKNLTWASGIGSDGRPIRLPNQEPSPQGTKVCPSQDGATNWFSPSFNPATGLYYVQTFEKCSIYTTRPEGPVAERTLVSRRLAAHRRRTRCRSGSSAPSTSHRCQSLGTAAGRPGRLLGRHAEHRDRPRLPRRGQRRPDGRRRRDRHAAVELQDQPDVEGFTDDLPVRWTPVHRRRGRPDHHRLRGAGLSDVRARPAAVAAAGCRLPGRLARVPTGRNHQSPAAGDRAPARSAAPATTAARASTGRARSRACAGRATSTSARGSSGTTRSCTTASPGRSRSSRPASHRSATRRRRSAAPSCGLAWATCASPRSRRIAGLPRTKSSMAASG